MSKRYKALVKNRVNYSKTGRRFYSQRDLAALKHDIDIRNSRVKRGECEPHKSIYPCQCGARGCFIITDRY